jgi:CRISPR-associated protein Csb2
MSGLTIGWDYLTGYCVATDPSSRERAEWPPHPGRVFMALAAAWFETGEDAEEGRTLRWLESLNDPQLVLPPRDHVFPREVVDVYVPVNDNADPYDWPDKKKKPTVHPPLTSVAVGRSRQARTFPCTWVGESPCFLHWPTANGIDLDKHGLALDRLCGKVTRIGHSSSLVRMWLAEESHPPHQADVWVPAESLADLRVRRVSSGTLDLLDRQFNGRGREEYGRLTSEIALLGAQKKTVRGKGAAERKAEIDGQIEQLETRRGSISNRDPIRPKLGLWTGYRRQEAAPPTPVKHADFDSDLVILTQTDGPRLPLASTLAVTQALRGAVMSQSGIQPPPSWVSGHLEDSQPLRDGRQHLACVPLPFVGGEYADGHLLGAALVFPREIPRQERGRVLGRFLLQPSGEANPVRLTLGPLGEWTLVKRDWSETRHALKPESWTAHPNGATTWATVTPVVLDRFPKADTTKERAKWEAEVADIIANACVRLGLPSPAEIRFGTTSWHRGSPRASVKRRLIRGQVASGESAALGDGFPAYPAKGSNGVRPQLHVCLRFAEPVVGPILLCAGRFLGYGLCKPCGSCDQWSS